MKLFLSVLAACALFLASGCGKKEPASSTSSTGNPRLGSIEWYAEYYTPHDGMKVYTVGTLEGPHTSGGLYHGQQKCPRLLMTLEAKHSAILEWTLRGQRLVDVRGLFGSANPCSMCLYLDDVVYQNSDPLVSHLEEGVSGKRPEVPKKVRELEGVTFYVSNWEVGDSMMGYNYYHYRKDCPTLREELKPSFGKQHWRLLGVVLRRGRFMDADGYFHKFGEGRITWGFCPQCVP